jgi:hypothetical protein
MPFASETRSDCRGIPNFSGKGVCIEDNGVIKIFSSVGCLLTINLPKNGSMKNSSLGSIVKEFYNYLTQLSQ